MKSVAPLLASRAFLVGWQKAWTGNAVTLPFLGQAEG